MPEFPVTGCQNFRNGVWLWACRCQNFRGIGTAIVFSVCQIFRVWLSWRASRCQNFRKGGLPGLWIDDLVRFPGESFTIGLGQRVGELDLEGVPAVKGRDKAFQVGMDAQVAKLACRAADLAGQVGPACLARVTQFAALFIPVSAGA